MLHHTVITSLYMFYTLSLNMIARITSMTTCVSLCTPSSYKNLFLMVARYRMYIIWKTVYSIVGEWKSYLSLLQNITTHTAHITVYITHKNIEWDWRIVFREYFHFTLQCLLLKALLLIQTEHFCDDIYYQTIHEILKTWLQLLHSLLYQIMNEFPKPDSPVLIVHTTTHFLQITVHIFQMIKKHHCKKVTILLSSFVSLYTPSSYDHISMM
jgi:hypothetical protein